MAVIRIEIELESPSSIVVPWNLLKTVGFEVPIGE